MWKAMLSTRMWEMFGPAGQGDVEELEFSIWNTCTLVTVTVAHLTEQLRQAPRCNPRPDTADTCVSCVHICFPFRCWMRTTT